MDSLSLSVVRCSGYERTYFLSTANFVAYSLMASVSLRVISDEFFTCWTMSIPYFLPYVEDITKMLTLRLKK